MDRDTFLKPRLAEREIDLPGVGTVRVRALARDEVFACQGLKDDQAAFEARVLSIGLVDPALSEDDVLEWRRNSPYDEAEAVLDAIRDLSKLSQGAAKSGVPGVPSQP